MARPTRPHITPIAGPILGEFLIGISVAMAGLWMASEISDATAGAFGMSQQVLESGKQPAHRTHERFPRGWMWK